MLATSASAPTSQQWATEVKWDGIRAQLRFDGHRLCVRSRSGLDCTTEFPELAAIREQLRGHSVILDGELVCLGADGKPDSTALVPVSGGGVAEWRIAAQRRLAKLVAFDVLHFDGNAVRELPYGRRRELLAELLVDGPALLVVAAQSSFQSEGLFPAVVSSLGCSFQSDRSCLPEAATARDVATCRASPEGKRDPRCAFGYVRLAAAPVWPRASQIGWRAAWRVRRVPLRGTCRAPAALRATGWSDGGGRLRLGRRRRSRRCRGRKFTP